MVRAHGAPERVPGRGENKRSPLRSGIPPAAKPDGFSRGFGLGWDLPRFVCLPVYGSTVYDLTFQVIGLGPPLPQGFGTIRSGCWLGGPKGPPGRSAKKAPAMPRPPGWSCGQGDGLESLVRSPRRLAVPFPAQIRTTTEVRTFKVRATNASWGSPLAAGQRNLVPNDDGLDHATLFRQRAAGAQASGGKGDTTALPSRKVGPPLRRCDHPLVMTMR